tara:strand:+ start:279 stop:422 length:144 start_codon:yes stop_codon:yes gene_type:complete
VKSRTGTDLRIERANNLAKKKTKKKKKKNEKQHSPASSSERIRERVC